MGQACYRDAMARISLCMIVRDEELFLARCLASARGAVDEIVVVDTGSRDGTIAIAEAAGARVVRRPWTDDFSAARNAALDAASGTHVLVLDADERLTPDGARALREAAADPSLLVGLMPLHDASGLDASPSDVVAGRARLWEPTWVPRLFRRDPRLRYSRRVHETLFRDPEAFAELARETSGRVETIDAPIAHYGEVKTLREDRGKRGRNVRLLELALADDPADGDLAGFLALELVRAGERKRARDTAARALPPFLAEIDRSSALALKPSPVQLASVLATLQLEDGEPARALECVRSALQRCVEPHPNLRFLEGAALERLGHADEAERAYHDCLAMHGRRFTITVNPGATDAAPRLRLASLALADRTRGRSREALKHLDAIERPAPAFETAARLLRCEALLDARQPLAALDCLKPLLASTSPPPDLYALAARASELLGKPDPALRRAAAEASRDRFLEPRRREALDLHPSDPHPIDPHPLDPNPLDTERS